MKTVYWGVELYGYWVPLHKEQVKILKNAIISLCLSYLLPLCSRVLMCKDANLCGSLWCATNADLQAEAHNPERATPILGLCHGVFMDQFIFRHILGDFFPRKLNLHHVNERIWSIWYQKKAKNMIFRSVGFADSFVEFERYSKFAPKPFWK